MSEVKKAVKMPSTEKKEDKHAKNVAKQNTTTVAKCTCVSPFQDKMYGIGMRSRCDPAKRTTTEYLPEREKQSVRV